MYKKIAKKRILELYNKALEIYDKDPELSRKYIEILEKIKEKARVNVKEIRNKYCKRCKTIWIPGKTLSIRVRKGRIIYKCLKCGYVKRFKIK